MPKSVVELLACWPSRFLSSSEWSFVDGSPALFDVLYMERVEQSEF